MEITVRHNPGFAVARMQLASGEECRAESGAMMAMSGGVEIESKAEGGIMKSLKRSVLSGESFFMTTFKAPEGGGFVDCAARLPGDITVFDASQGIALTKGSYLCSAKAVEIDSSWGGFKNMWGGEGGFLVRASGQGAVAAACYGALDTIDLQEGESFVLDSGHLVGYTGSMNFTTRKVAKGLIQTMKSGEGLVMDFQGPGRIYCQTRNPGEFIGWMTEVLPFSRA
ncbi:MAG: hypothetical protein QOJ57_349 [Thermoleophilaceae bacterium]|jgi:uncharacterized protein (TIGR00266 family)|nr:hypothetical protein [Thermoleophilaceae bacterium]